jgi:lipopolysaccharide export system protein LptA
MPVSLGANGGSYNYPQENDPAGWGDDATNWASAVSAALSNIGLGGTASADAVVNIISTTKGVLIPRMTTTQRNAIGSPSTSLLIYNTTTTQHELYTGSTWQSLASYISGTLTVTGAASLQSTLAVNGNTTLGDASGDTLTITGNVVSTPNGLNIDSNTLVVDATNNRVGINTASPTVALDITGDIKASSTIQSANGTATAPGITFSGDTNTGIYNIAADTIGFSANGAESARIDSQGIEIIDGTAAAPSLAFSSDPDTGVFRPGANQFSITTGGVERFRIESTGQIKAVYESTSGTDYNTTLDNGYLCRAWVNFNGTGTVAIRASGNVSSITDNNTGDYTVNFTTAMPDANYSSVCTNGETQRKLYSTYGVIASSGNISANTASTCRLGVFDDNTNLPLDVASFSVGVFR